MNDGMKNSSICGCISGTGERAGTDTPVFECTSGENVILEQLCDGIADCGAGDDETTPLCESKLLTYSSPASLLTVG
jgi:hypothetical protein